MNVRANRRTGDWRTEGHDVKNSFFIEYMQMCKNLQELNIIKWKVKQIWYHCKQLKALSITHITDLSQSNFLLALAFLQPVLNSTWVTPRYQIFYPRLFTLQNCRHCLEALVITLILPKQQPNHKYFNRAYTFQRFFIATVARFSWVQFWLQFKFEF